MSALASMPYPTPTCLCASCRHAPVFFRACSQGLKQSRIKQLCKVGRYVYRWSALSYSALQMYQVRTCTAQPGVLHHCTACVLTCMNCMYCCQLARGLNECNGTLAVCWYWHDVVTSATIGTSCTAIPIAQNLQPTAPAQERMDEGHCTGSTCIDVAVPAIACGVLRLTPTALRCAAVCACTTEPMADPGHPGSSVDHLKSGRGGYPHARRMTCIWLEF